MDVKKQAHDEITIGKLTEKITKPPYAIVEEVPEPLPPPSYSYTFDTGLQVQFSQEEKDAIEKLFQEEKRRMEAKYKKDNNYKLTWSNANISRPYSVAIQKYFKHELFPDEN